MVKWMDYYKIQEYKRKKFNKSQTARKLGINRETVGVYWDMTPESYAARAEAAKTREKKADPHKDFVLECLLKYPDMSAAQLYDWIKERTCLETLDFQERCFRDYVKSIREEYDIKKPETSRQYEAMDELPLGQQAQVDMGEISLKTLSGRHKKVYCFGMVMTHSRYKFILWQERPFTTDTFVQAHIKAFAFFGGRPSELVYDQDKILAVSENNGDIIYTEGFQNYVNEVKFDIFLCHGADPESKGLIENVVKYAKHGFAEHRIFRDIDSFNADCIAWLKRTGNKKEHGTTKKIPAEVFALEKEHLIPVSEYSFVVAANDSIDYQVRKDNIVLYKGNRYRVPKGTYSPGKRVFMVVSDETVTITDTLSGEIYATHPLCHDKGQLIGQKRANRDKSKSLQEQENLIQQLFQEDELVSPFLEHIHQAKPRYYRDQLGVIRKLFEEWNTELLIQGLHYCQEKELYSAGDLKSSIIYLEQLKAEPRKTENLTALPSKYRGNTPEIRDLSVYEQAMERSVVNG
ncbi:MAG: IS21 family transposase [Anaerostipes sp.]|jgi:transposase